MRGISVAFAKPAKASNLSLVTESWDFELLEEDDFVDMEFIKVCLCLYLRQYITGKEILQICK